MSSINFNKYQTRGHDYHWQQIAKNLFTFNAYVQARYQQIVDQIPKSNNLKILDIGCGDGVLLYLISQKNKSLLTGIDLDQDSLKIATTKVKAKFIKASAYKLPVKSSSYDYVLASEIIEHLDQPKKMLIEIKRVLKPKGIVIITTPVKLFQKPEDSLHVQEFTVKDINQILRQYFSQIKIITSHPFWLKKFYTFTLFKFGRFHLGLFRWLINAIVFCTGYNPFLITSGRSTQQVAVARK